MKPTKLPILLFTLLAVIVLLALALAGCEEMREEPSPKATSTDESAQTTETSVTDEADKLAEAEAKIKAAYAKQFNKKEETLSIEFVADLGDAYAMFVDGPWEYPQATTVDIVNGYRFHYSSSRKMKIYKDGVIYQLPEAYEKGVLNEEQLYELCWIYTTGSDSVTSPLPPVSSTPTTTQVPVTTQRPIVTVPATEPEETLPPLELTIPIPDRGEMSQKVESEIKATYADEYDADELTVEFVAKLGDAYAVFVDGPWMYPCMETEQIVHGYLFTYSSGRTMTIYKDGARYSLPKAYKEGVIDAKQVLDLNLIRHGSVRVRDPEKDYSKAKLEYDFVDNHVIIWVFPEYNDYVYSVEDFAEIGCIDLYESPWQNYEDGKSFRRMELTLDEKNKQNVLDCIQILQLRVDIRCADVKILEYAE